MERARAGVVSAARALNCATVHSVSAGLDYPGVGPEHSSWKDSGRVRYTSVGDAEALQGFALCSRLEGILPALETGLPRMTSWPLFGPFSSLNDGGPSSG